MLIGLNESKAEHSHIEQHLSLPGNCKIFHADLMSYTSIPLTGTRQPLTDSADVPMERWRWPGTRQELEMLSINYIRVK